MAFMIIDAWHLQQIVPLQSNQHFCKAPRLLTSLNPLHRSFVENSQSAHVRVEITVPMSREASILFAALAVWIPCPILLLNLHSAPLQDQWKEPNLIVLQTVAAMYPLSQDLQIAGLAAVGPSPPHTPLQNPAQPQKAALARLSNQQCPEFPPSMLQQKLRPSKMWARVSLWLDKTATQKMPILPRTELPAKLSSEQAQSQDLGCQADTFSGDANTVELEEFHGPNARICLLGVTQPRVGAKDLQNYIVI